MNSCDMALEYEDGWNECLPDCVQVDANKLVGVLDGVNQDTDFNLNVSNVVIKELKNAIQGPLLLTANIILSPFISAIHTYFNTKAFS